MLKPSHTPDQPMLAPETEQIVGEVREKVGRPAFVYALGHLNEELGRCTDSIDDRRCLKSSIYTVFYEWPFLRYYQACTSKQQQMIKTILKDMIGLLEELGSDMSDMAQTIANLLDQEHES